MSAVFSFVLDEIDMRLFPDPLAIRSLEISPFPIAADSCNKADLSRLKELDDDVIVPPFPALKPTLMPMAGDIRPAKRTARAKNLKLPFNNMTSFISPMDVVKMIYPYQRYLFLGGA
jgi:hypothetical protein